MADENDKEILIPEVLPPARGEERRQAWREPRASRAEQAQRAGAVDRVANFLGPIVAGVMLDLVHMSRLRGLALIIPAILGFWFARVCNLGLRHCFFIMLASALFPGIGGKFIPIATAVGIFFAVRNNKLKSGGAR